MKPRSRRSHHNSKLHAKSQFCEDAGKAKRGYKTKYLAKRAMYETWRVADGNTKPTRVYYCGACAVWHLTSRPKKFREEPQEE